MAPRERRVVSQHDEATGAPAAQRWSSRPLPARSPYPYLRDRDGCSWVVTNVVWVEAPDAADGQCAMLRDRPVAWLRVWGSMPGGRGCGGYVILATRERGPAVVACSVPGQQGRARGLPAQRWAGQAQTAGHAAWHRPVKPVTCLARLLG